MNLICLIGGFVAFGLSFVVHQYFIQFIVLGVFLTILYMINKNSQDVGELKRIIEEHNELMKKDIEAIKGNK